MISVSVCVGEAIATLEWDGDAGWHPEVATDMARRAVNAAVMAAQLAEQDSDAEG